MSLKRLSGPAAEPLTLAAAKLFLRVDQSAEDSAITALISAARQIFERETGLVLISQDWDWVIDCWPAPTLGGRRILNFPLAPVLSIAEIAVNDNLGGTLDVPPTDYIADLAANPPRVLEKAPARWPLPRLSGAGVRVTFTAGYGTTPSDVPADIAQALLAIVGALYERRNLEAGEPDLAAPSLAALFAPYRRVRL